MKTLNYCKMTKDSFPFYVQDFTGGTAHFTMEERGVYISLLCFQWTQGKIPISRLGHILGPEFETAWETVSSKFIEIEPGFVINNRLEIERGKLEKKRAPKKPNEPKEKVIPTLNEFIEYAMTKEPLLNPSAVKLKYEAWIDNDWKNGNNAPIINWKSNVNNTIPFIQKVNPVNISPAGTQQRAIFGRQTEETLKNNLKDWG